LFTGFILPDPGIPGYILNQWVDDAGVKYNAGSLVTNFYTRYSAKIIQFCKNNFFAKSLNNSQTVNLNLVLNCPGRGMEIANVTFDNNKFGLNMTLPLTVATGDTSFSLPLKLMNPETKLFITRYEVTYKMDGQTKTNSDNLYVATIIEDNSELSIVGKRAIEAYNSSIDSNQVATLNNRGVIYRLLGYPDLAKPLFDNAVSLGLSKFYAFTGIKMNQGVVESDKKKSTDANTIYESALSDIGTKKDSSVLAPQIFYNQAWELYMNENYTGAESLALKTLNHTKANAWLKAKAAALLGAIKYNKGDKEGAVVAFQTAYTIDSNGPIGIMARENIQLITSTDDLSNETGFQVYPQPANNYLIIECKGKSLQKVNIELSDLSGKVVYSCQSYPSGSGFYHFVDVNDFPAGMYNLKLVSDGLMQVFKIIVQ
jgi:tetratricopeptide (TPR) repeat protein